MGGRDSGGRGMIPPEISRRRSDKIRIVGAGASSADLIIIVRCFSDQSYHSCLSVCETNISVMTSEL